MIKEFDALVCDDVMVNLSGKTFINGLYSGDIVFNVEGGPIAQLVVFFVARVEIADLPTQLILEVNFPKSQTKRVEVQLPLPTTNVVRESVSFRYPILMQNCPLYPGRIEAKITMGAEEKLTTAGWLVRMPPASPGLPS